MEPTSTRSRLEKLGMRPGARVAVVGVTDPELQAELAAWTDDLTIGAPGPATDLVFLAADRPDDLVALAAMRACIRPAGAIWVVARKGPAATVRDVEVMAAARAAGLVDNKVVAFSATHTALRLVIPLVLRTP